MSFGRFLWIICRIIGKALKYLTIYVGGGAYIFLYGIWCLTGPNTTANYWHCLYWLVGSIIIAVFALWTLVKDINRAGITTEEIVAGAVKKHMKHYR